jgi:hypothetical protein
MPRGSVVVEAPCYKPEGHGFETLWGEWIFPIYLIFPGALDPEVYSASTRSRKMFLGSRARPVRGADELTAVSEPTVRDPRRLTAL